MCGICGRVNFDRERPVDAATIVGMMDLIAHRGPDGSGRFVAGNVGLGHRRLSIIDLSTGTQPMGNEDDTVWVVFNGEIYNFRALRADLEKRGHRFRSTTDTEVIVHLYEEFGDDCVTHLQGMFAFALWDTRRQRLLLARDRVGIKPLYFADTGEAIVFASEIKALLADPDVDRRIDPGAVDRFLTYYYLPGGGTMHARIAKLEPGHLLTVADGKASIRRYWDLRFERAATTPSFAAAADELAMLLARAVDEHMASDVPVGVLLSGGVDSTAILAHAAAHADGPLHSFTMGFDDAGFADERPFARLAAERFGTVHHETSMSAAQFGQFLRNYVWHMEEPVCEPPAIGLYFVSKLARDHDVKVLLSGEGGDEAFGGYPEYRNLMLLERMKSAAGPFGGVLKGAFGALSRAGWTRGAHYADLIDRSAPDYYFSRTSTPASPFNRMRTSHAVRHAASPSRRLWERTAGLPLLDRMLYVDTKTWLPDDLLVKADKMTMATSVELRVPLLDTRILEFAASLPARYKVAGFRLKRVLKAATAAHVPAAILGRKKTGFPVPYARWMRHELRDFVHDTLLRPDAFVGHCFSRRGVEALLAADARGAGCPKEIFSLLVLELWHAQFTPSAPTPPATGIVAPHPEATARRRAPDAILTGPHVSLT